MISDPQTRIHTGHVAQSFWSTTTQTHKTRIQAKKTKMPSAPAMEVKTQEKSSLPLDNIWSGEHLPAEPNPEQPSDTLDRSESEPMTAIPILRSSARV